uniref:Major perivitellin subunit 2 n=1 Tax=Pomacea scalaris TaxID=527798 RepID=A0A2U8SZJ8_9CAEN|nr:major perivitellin subunit 2 [Pomacea scalaris]
MAEHRIAVFLFLVVVAASSLAQMLPHQKYYIIYEVKDSEKSPQEIRGEMKDTEVLYSFKALGAPSYHIVVEVTSRNLRKLEEVELKGKTKMVPVIDMYDLAKTFGVTWRYCGEHLSDTNLTLVERTLPLEGLTTQQSRAHLKAFMEEIKDRFQKYNYRAFYTNGSSPPKMYIYINIPLGEVDDFASKGTNLFGGPGALYTSVSFLSSFPK